MQYNIIQNNTIQCNTILYNTMQYNIIQHNTIQCNTILYNTIQYYIIQYNTIQYNTISYNTIQYNTIQYNTIQCNAIQYNTTLTCCITPNLAVAKNWLNLCPASPWGWALNQASSIKSVSSESRTRDLSLAPGSVAVEVAVEVVMFRCVSIVCCNPFRSLRNFDDIQGVIVND